MSHVLQGLKKNLRPSALQTVEIVHFWEDLRACFHPSHYSYYSHWLRLRRAGLICFHPRFAFWFFALTVCLGAPSVLRADDIPPKPAQYFNDYAHVVDAGTAEALNNELENFERQTSNQIVVAIYPKLQTEDSLDDYCYRVFQAWGVGQKKLSNGASLFLFVQDHKMRIQTGYGLEGALPDITCVRIQDDEMAPYFKRGDYAGGLRAGVDAMIAAAKGEYKGTGRTVKEQHNEESSDVVDWIFVIIFLLIFFSSFFRRTRGVMYNSGGIGSYGGWFLGGGGGGGGGGWGGGGGGGGGFMGGGRSSGGGGASGSW